MSFSQLIPYFPIGKSNSNILFHQNNLYINISQSKIKMREPVHFIPDESFYTTSYTFSFDKYSCVSWMYPLHIMFAYLVVLTGFLAIISRAISKLRPYHSSFGRWYIIFMLWTMASSLLIHNTGLPLPILVSFVYLLVSIAIGWTAIRVYINSIAETVKQRMNIRVNLLLRGQISSYNDKPIDLQELQSQQKTIVLTSKTFRQRLFSAKMVHGLLMTFSWAQMLGRTLVTNPFTSFSYGCWTYPAYKSLDGSVIAVDGQATPGFPMQTSIFLIMITVPTVIIILAVALISTYCFYRQQQAKVKEVNVNSVSPPNSQGLNN